MARQNKLFYFLVIFILPMWLSAQETGKDSVINYTDISGNKQGKWIKYYDNDQIRYKGFFIDDQPQDTFVHYHRNGELKARQIFNDDGSSRTKMYWNNGNIAAQGKFNKKKNKEGRWVFYFETGEKESEVDYSDGKKDGDKIDYFKNGQVLMEVEYQDDVKEGEYVFYFKNGQVREKGFYHDGVRHGEFVYRRPDGVLAEKGVYKNGKRVGEWKIRNDDGEMETVTYIKGERTDRDSLEKAFHEYSEWAEENQDKIDDPEDFKENPLEYFLKHDNR
ncbi:MAG: toxin-antitoxin system YwqK family antitoxin [Bacteroidales bacterium]